MYRDIRYPVKEGELLAAHVTMHGTQLFCFVSALTDPVRQLTKEENQRMLDVINSSNEWQSFIAMHCCVGCGCPYALFNWAMMLLICVCIGVGLTIGWLAGPYGHWGAFPLALVVFSTAWGMQNYYNKVNSERAYAVEVFIVSLLERVHRETGVKWTLNDAIKPPPRYTCGSSRDPIGWKMQPRRAYLTVSQQLAI